MAHEGLLEAYVRGTHVHAARVTLCNWADDVPQVCCFPPGELDDYTWAFMAFPHDPVHDSLRLAAIIEGSDDAIISKDVNGIITSWNAAAERMFGYTPAEAVGQSIRIIIPLERQSEEDDVLARIRRGDRVEHFETERRRRTGELLHVSITVSPIRTADGRIIGASKIARDITERKRTEEALATALSEQADLERRLTTIIGASSALLMSPRLEDVSPAIVNVARDIVPADACALWWMDGDCWRVTASRGLSERFTAVSHPAGSDIDLTGTDLRIVEDTDDPQLASRQTAYQAEGLRAALVVPLTVGSDVVAAIAFYYRRPRTFSSVEQEGARGLGKLASAVIATAQLYDEQRRRRQESTFIAEAGSLLASSLDYHDTLTRLSARLVPGMSDWCAFYLAVEDEQIARVAASAAPGIDLTLIESFERGGDDDQEASFSVERVIRSGAAAIVADWRHDGVALGDRRRAAGEAVRVVSALGVPLVAHSRVFGALTMGTIDDRRRFASADLRFAQDLAYRAALSIDNIISYEEARAANRLKDEFLATLSHELRTPLNAIAGYSRMLRTNRMSEDRKTRAYEVLDNNASALTQMVDDVLDVSRIVTGKIRLRMAPVELAAVVAQSVDTVRPTVDAKGIRLDVAAADAGANVTGDADRLQQIFWNLLSNAVKFTPSDGRITVRVAVDGDMCEVAVADTGSGIDTHFLPHMFERFRQGDSRFAREHGGLGLGLAIARQIVEMHGGTIAAESEGPGRGATFRVRLPRLGARS